MNTKAIHLSIAGNIGAGKTTLAKMLAKHFQYEILLENVDSNPYLADFYSDMSRWAFHLQVFFLNSRFEQSVQISKSGQSYIQDRTIYEDAHVFALSLYEQNIMSRRDYDNYLSLFQSMSGYIKAPDLLIYLQSNVKSLKKNIQKRNRDYETNISSNYLINLNQHYETWINNYNEGNLLIINADRLDYVRNNDDFEKVVMQIKSNLFTV